MAAFPLPCFALKSKALFGCSSTKTLNAAVSFMHQKNFLTLRLFLTGLLPLFVWTLLAWQHSHGGVASHHLLADAALPAISNWWGGLLLPLLTGFLLYRIQKRVYGKPDGLPKAPQLLRGAFSGFIGALTFGILLSTFFTFGEEDLCGYLILGLLPLALFYPLYRAECLLGFVLGMTFTFGGVLPTGIGLLFALAGVVQYRLIRPAIGYVVARFALLVSSSKQ